MTNILETVVFAEGEDAVNTQAQTAETTETTSADAEQVAEANPVMSTVVSILPLVLIIVLLYFMMIRPQRKKEKETKEMINSMKVGDKVVTIGGICGKVARIKDEFVFIETGNIGTPDEKSVIKMERDAVKTVESNKN
ncbi:MAG: preprotein translocase subunit YajC [Oscillospiraceae bacterium]|nr:preprotein translocase subunit YajC [Oscillospiraceae bacterium]